METDNNETTTAIPYRVVRDENNSVVSRGDPDYLFWKGKNASQRHWEQEVAKGGPHSRALRSDMETKARQVATLIEAGLLSPMTLVRLERALRLARAADHVADERLLKEQGDSIRRAVEQHGTPQARAWFPRWAAEVRRGMEGADDDGE